MEPSLVTEAADQRTPEPGEQSDAPQVSVGSDARHVLRGFLMGGADVIPGVSGGTVALILGIYQRLVTAISHFDLTLVELLRQRNRPAAARHVDLRFLAALGTGILLGIGSLASVMNWLLTQPHTQPPTLGAFYGLIIASAVLVAKMVEVRQSRDVSVPLMLAIVGALFAYWLTGLRAVTADPTYIYIFFGGMLAICAMILPGISGAFILLILGLYVYVTGVIKRALHLDVGVDDLLTVVVFGSGCAIGLITFSKFLRWLLARHEPQTMGLLCGLMIGSLRKIWPFKRDVTLEHLDSVGLPAEKVAEIRADPGLLSEVDMKHRLMENIPLWEVPLDDRTLLTVGVAVAAGLAVFLLDRITGGHQNIEPLVATPPGEEP